MGKYAIVNTTVSKFGDANRLAALLLEKKLAACIQINEVRSHYVWQGEVQVDSEYLLTIKSRLDLFERIKQTISENHSYDTPEIIQIPIINGSERYFKWIDDVTESV